MITDSPPRTIPDIIITTGEITVVLAIKVMMIISSARAMMSKINARAKLETAEPNGMPSLVLTI